MKTIVAFYILFSTFFSFAQSADVAGNYALTLQTNDGNIFQYEMTLATDGTFSFHYYSNIKNGIPPETNKFAKGTWTTQNNVVTFATDKKNDLNQTHELDFTNTKARFLTKSPRDKSDKIVPVKLQFLNSGSSWIGRIDLLKV